MCDFKAETRMILARRPMADTLRGLDARARRPLVAAIRSGRAARGRDLLSGRRLPAPELMKGHYYSPESFSAVLRRLRPDRCAWCGGALRAGGRGVPAPPREMRPYHHPLCWEALLLAVGLVLGTIDHGRLVGALPGPRTAPRLLELAPQRSRWLALPGDGRSRGGR